MGAWRGRRASPVYQQLPSLREPDWKTLKVGDINEFWQGLEAWQSRVKVALPKQRPGDILVLAEETPNSGTRIRSVTYSRARAHSKLNRPRYALNILERARQLEPEDVETRQIEGSPSVAQTLPEAREAYVSREERKEGETLGLLARTWKDEWTQIWNAHPQRKAGPVASARDTAATLQSAAAAYIKAFRAAPSDLSGNQRVDLGKAVGARHRPVKQAAARVDRTGVGWTAGAAARAQQGLLVAGHPSRTRADRKSERRRARRLFGGGGDGGG